MKFSTVDIATLRRQLGREIDRALQTSEHLGVTIVSCHLQMARDMLQEPATPFTGPTDDSTGSDRR